MKPDEKEFQKVFGRIPAANQAAVRREVERIRKICREKLWYKRLPKKIGKALVAEKVRESLKAFKFKGEAKIDFFVFYLGREFVNLIVVDTDLPDIGKWNTIQEDLIAKYENFLIKNKRVEGEAIEGWVHNHIEEAYSLSLTFRKALLQHTTAKDDSNTTADILIETLYACAVGDIMWEASSDLLKKAGYEENPFRPLVDIMEMGLLPLGPAKMNKRFAFWVGVPIRKGIAERFRDLFMILSTHE